MSNQIKEDHQILPGETRYKANPTGERFLFFFTPEEPALQAPCGCSLKTGAQIVALFFILCTFPGFLNSFNTNDIVTILFYLSASILYFIAGVCVIYSSLSYNYIYAHTASLIYNFCFLVNFLDYAVVIAMVFMGRYTPMPGPIDKITLGIYLSVSAAVILLIHLYLIWVVYSFMVHLKHGRISLVKGYVYKSYEEFDRDNLNTNRI
jgi:hypothetical protein